MAALPLLPSFAHRYYSEQCLLAVDLLARNDTDRIVLPCIYITAHPRLRKVLEALWRHPHLGEIKQHGASMWLQS